MCLFPAGVPVSFAEVSEAVRLTRQTAIGYIRSKDADRQRRKAVLGCSGSHRVTFAEADRIVVIALVSRAGEGGTSQQPVAIMAHSLTACICLHCSVCALQDYNV